MLTILAQRHHDKILRALSLWTCERCMRINRDHIDPCIFCGKPKPKK